MNHTKLESSFIATVGYDPDQKLLEIRMSNGCVYRATDVEPEDHTSLCEAESAGRAFNELKFRYDFQRHGK